MTFTLVVHTRIVIASTLISSLAHGFIYIFHYMSRIRAVEVGHWATIVTDAASEDRRASGFLHAD